MLMSTELVKIIEKLESSNIDVRTFKGPSLSQIAYGDISSRQYVDLDLFIDVKNLEKVENLFLELNYEKKYILTEYQNENILNLVHDVSYSSNNGVIVEIHWRLLSDEFFINLDRLNYWDNFTDIKIFDKKIKTFNLDKLFIYLCIHGFRHLWERFEWLLDIENLVQKNIIDLENVLKLSKKIDCDRIVLSSLFLCNKIFSNKKIEDFLLKTNIEKKTLKISSQMLKNIFSSNNSTEKVHTKQISYIQWYMLKSYSNRIKYIKSFFHPTEDDYESIHLGKAFHFLYYIIRLYNLSRKFLKNKNK